MAAFPRILALKIPINAKGTTNAEIDATGMYFKTGEYLTAKEQLEEQRNHE